MWRQTLSHVLKLKVALIGVCLLAFVGAAAVGARHLLTSTAAVADAAAPAPQEGEGRESAELVVINLRPEGFEPSEMTLPAGRHLFVFNNRTGLDEFALRLERDGQGTVREGRPPRFKRNWRQMVRLAPGTYVVTEMGHPEWTLRVTVTP